VSATQARRASDEIADRRFETAARAGRPPAVRPAGRNDGAFTGSELALLVPLNLRSQDLADAETCVRRHANKHGCAGRSCAHPPHGRDAAMALPLLRALGLRPDPAGGKK
jgi:hypothetical protein